MKFRMFFGIVKTALIALIALAGAVIIVLDAIMVSGAVPAFETANATVAAVSLVAAVLIDAFALMLLFGSVYKLREDGLYARMAVFCDFVPYEGISRISVNAATGEIFVAWRKSGEGADTVSRLNLTEKDAKTMLTELERKCPVATVDYFTPPQKKKKD